MAYISGYKYDIFISYAHVDNLTASEKESGWIEQFYKNLEISLAKRTGRVGKVNIWLDNKRLIGSTLFDASIEETLQQSAIILCLNSPGYNESDYCQKELSVFHNKSKEEPWGINIGNQSRIFNILLNNIPYNQWPTALSGTTGFPFHTAIEKNDFGDPLDIQSPDFRSQLEKLRDALMKIFNDFNLRINSTLPTSEKSSADKEKPFTIYFGEVSDSLRTVNKRSMNELSKKGFDIISGIPPPFENEAHQHAAKEKISTADLSIHMLDQFPGKEIIDAPGIWYPQQQTEIGLENAKSTLIWVPADIKYDEIEEEEYQRFLNTIANGTDTSLKYEFIRGNKSSLTQEISDIADQLKNHQKIQADKSQTSVLLDTHFTDQIYAMELGKKLLENNIQPFINPQEDDPRKNIYLLADRVSQVKKLIFFYGRVSRDWVKERMNAALQLILSNNYPIDEFYLLLTPPDKEKESIELNQQRVKLIECDNSHDTEILSSTVETILKNIKGVAS